MNIILENWPFITGRVNDPECVQFNKNTRQLIILHSKEDYENMKSSTIRYEKLFTDNTNQVDLFETEIWYDIEVVIDKKRFIQYDDGIIRYYPKEYKIVCIYRGEKRASTRTIKIDKLEEIPL